jgi:penicillin-binding protein 1A
VRRLLRLVLIALVGAALIAGAVMTISATGNGIATHLVSAEPIPLAPLTQAPEDGSTVYAADGKTVLAVFHASATRKPVTLSNMTPVLIKAVLDTEDERYYLHGGFDIPSTLRALVSDSSTSGGLQGGSTITQQLVKQVYLTSQRKLSRKIKEAVIADRLQKMYTKDQILETYLNTIYLGNGAYGVEAAANAYFDEGANQVTLPQAALLAGLIQDPNGYDPIQDPSAARTRRAEVLSRMVHYHDITQAQADAANATPLPTTVTTPLTANDQIDDYYVQEVETQLLSENSPLGGNYAERYNALFEGGLKIYTDLDPNLQALAEQKVAQDTPANTRGFEEAMVVIDPSTGKVRAMVGGSGFNQSKFDVITQGTRQPGSGFKLFTLLAALDQGYSVFDTVDAQSPCAIDFPTDHDLLKSPAHNDEGPGGGVVSVVDATAESLNCGFIRIAHEVGLANVIAMAHRLGITEQLPLFPSIVIGSNAVHPIEMAAAYATVAADGIYHTPSYIDHIVDRTGATIYTGGDPGHRVLSTQVAREAEIALRAVVTSGTGVAAELPNRQVAGKTGTTENADDAWFNGFVPQLEATVWMGSPVGETSMTHVGAYYQVYGGDYPAQTWHDFMAAALAAVPPVPFLQPDYSQLPPSQYITSPSLVIDDHLGHNQVTTTTTSTTTAPTSSTSAPGSSSSTSTPPGTGAPTSPPTGVPPPPDTSHGHHG